MRCFCRDNAANSAIAANAASAGSLKQQQNYLSKRINQLKKVK